MAKAEKYRIPFVNVQGHSCVVRFFFEGWGGGVTELTGGARPFTLGEFNTDEDLFKPVRPQQATIEIIAQAGVIGLDDFLADNDSDISVQFDFDTWTGYWVGYLSQADMQETWIDTSHVLTLRATEGIGDQKTIQLNDGFGEALIGRFTPLQYIQYSLQGTAVPFTEYNVVSNLLYEGMNSTVTDTGIDQCYVDARTFQQNPEEFDDCYTVLEKVNRSWTQTIFQWLGKWWIFRMEELFQFPTFQFNGFRATPLSFPTRTQISDRWDISVGVGESVKPVAPEMIKFKRKPAKETKIIYNWEDYDEIICNESFSRGELKTETTAQETYEVDQWEHFSGENHVAPTPSTGIFERIVEFEDGKVQDDYVTFFSGLTDDFIRSCPVYVNKNDYIEISFQHRYLNNTSSDTGVVTAFVLLYADDGTFHALVGNDGGWTSYVSPGAVPDLISDGVSALLADYAIGQDWQETSVEAVEPAPESGLLRVILYRQTQTGFNVEKQFKDLKLTVIPKIQKQRNRQIVGDFDAYTLVKNPNNNFEEEVYLDDADSKNHKGSIFLADGTLTGDRWYRRRLNTERFTFKRHHALAQWFLNRSYKDKIDANFFGLTWFNDGVEQPIGLINTVRFVDDAPTKVFGITNLKEIDFMSCIWTASLLEVYDTDFPDDVPDVDQETHSFDYIIE